MPREQPAFDLRILNRFAQALAETKDLREVKSLRDKADAARKYIANARLGQKLQNLAAALKLRAERRIGQLLRELIPHGGNRRSSRHRADLRLSDLGIDSSQSSRWRREAAVPEAVFEQYLGMANEFGQDITSQGLLRLARTMTDGRPRHSRSDSACSESTDSSSRSCDSGGSELFRRNGTCGPHTTFGGEAKDGPIRELLVEMSNHRNLLASILEPICEGKSRLKLPLSQRRIIARLLAEIEWLIQRLEKRWLNDSGY
jgi:hypothetical protein